MPRKKKLIVPIELEVRIKEPTDTSMTYFIICDGSGSMAPYQGDVISGLNKILKDAKAEKDNSRIWMTTFDTRHKVVFENSKLTELRTLTGKDTFLGGGTALLDAIGETLTKAQKTKLVGKKTVVIYTDGEENSSTKWTKGKIKGLIEKLQAKDWTFMFMSADVDNFDEAMSLGIKRGNYLGTTSDTSLGNFRGISQTLHVHKQSPTLSSVNAYASAGIDVEALERLQEEVDQED